MRHPTALILLLAAGCVPGADRELEAPTFDATDIAASLSCEPRPAAFDPPGDVERMTAAGDSFLLLVYADAREVVVVDASLSVARRIRLEPEGPTGVSALHDAAWVDDSVFVVADGPRRALRAITPDGELRWTVRLPVMPDRVLATPAGVAVFPLVVPGVQASGAYLVRDGRVQDLGVQPVVLDDPQMGSLANLASPAMARGTRRLVVLRQFIAPVASLVDLSGKTRPRRRPIPVAASTLDKAWWAPGPPYVEHEVQQIIAPAISVTAGPGAGELSVLTRSGAMREGFTEKAVIRLDEALRVQEGWTVSFNAAHIAWLASERAYYIMTADEDWYRCTVPSHKPPVDHP